MHQTYMRPKAQSRASMHWTRIPRQPPHNRPNTQAQSPTTLLITQTGKANKKPPTQNLTHVTRISQPASLQPRTPCNNVEERNVRRTPACARSDTTSRTCTCTSTLPPNAHPLHLHPRFQHFQSHRRTALCGYPPTWSTPTYGAATAWHSSGYPGRWAAAKRTTALSTGVCIKQSVV
jgi:hypothetical protein